MTKKSTFIYVNFDLGFDLGGIPEYLIQYGQHVTLYNIYFKDTEHEGGSYIRKYTNGIMVNDTILEKDNPKSPYGIVQMYIKIYKNIRGIVGVDSETILISSNPVFNLFAIILGLRNLYFVGDIMRTNWTTVTGFIFSKILQGIIRVTLYRSYQTWYISRSLFEFFHGYRALQHNEHIGTLPIKSNMLSFQKNSHKTLIYIGTFDISKGFDIILLIAKNMSQYKFVLIGGTLDASIEISANVIIYPPTMGDNLTKIIEKESCIGLALYKPEGKSHLSYLGDPTKIKQYLSYGIPVISTNIVEFSLELDVVGAGISVGYNLDECILAIEKMAQNFDLYSQNVQKLIQKYNYKFVYDQYFTHKFYK